MHNFHIFLVGRPSRPPRPHPRRAVIIACHRAVAPLKLGFKRCEQDLEFISASSQSPLAPGVAASRWRVSSSRLSASGIACCVGGGERASFTGPQRPDWTTLRLPWALCPTSLSKHKPSNARGLHLLLRTPAGGRQLQTRRARYCSYREQMSSMPEPHHSAESAPLSSCPGQPARYSLAGLVSQSHRTALHTCNITLLQIAVCVQSSLLAMLLCRPSTSRGLGTTWPLQGNAAAPQVPTTSASRPRRAVPD